MNFSNMFRIARRELRSYFVSPIAYIVIVIFLIVTGWFFFSPFFLIGRADIRDFLSLLPILLVFFVPAITMRSYAEEFGSGSYEIISTLPVTELDILLGKFLSAFAFVMLMLAPTLSYPLWISGLGELDWGPVLGGYLGAILLSGTYAAIGLFTSSLTRNQIVSFIAGTALCFLLYIVDKMLFLVPSFLAGLFQYLGADYHFRNIAKGIIDTRDIVYFVSVIVVALYATRLATEERR
jgi:ABC-2 type transport system permease protein